MFQLKNECLVKNNVKRIFKNKPNKLEPLLKQFDISLNTERSTLSSPFITHYLHADGKKPIIVTWCGSTDKVIMERLKIPNIHAFIDMTTRRNKEIGGFDLKLINMKDKQILFTAYIGVVNKKGDQLNLEETHALICSQKHDFTYYHDPETDVNHTKCIFNYLVRHIQPINLFSKCYEL